MSTILNTYGFALIGAAVILPFLVANSGFGIKLAAALSLGIVFHAAALYISPYGDHA